jgi:hypothetical protein
MQEDKSYLNTHSPDWNSCSPSPTFDPPPTFTLQFTEYTSTPHRPALLILQPRYCFRAYRADDPALPLAYHCGLSSYKV